MTPQEHIDYIKRQLVTRHLWSLEDYQDFYDRDVAFLLLNIDSADARLRAQADELAAMKAELARVTQAAAGGY